MPLTWTPCGGGSELGLTEIPPLYVGSYVDVPLTADVDVGDLLLVFAPAWAYAYGMLVEDPQGNTWWGSGGTVGGFSYSRIEHALSTGESLRLTFSTNFFGALPTANHRPGCAFFKLAGTGVPPFTSIPSGYSDPLAPYFDLNDEDGGASVYRPASGDPGPFVDGTSVPAYRYQNNAGTREEISLVWYEIQGRHPASPGPWIWSDYPAPDTPAAPSGFSSSATFTQRRNMGGFPPAWTKGQFTLFVRNPLPDNTVIDTDALNYGAGYYSTLVSWLTLTFPAPPAAGEGPWCLQTRAGQYHIAYTAEGVVNYRRSNLTVPPFETLTTIPGGGNDRGFKMWEEDRPVAGRARGIWIRDDAVVTAASDDDGDSWSDPVTLWPDTPAPDHCTGNHDPLSQYTVYMASISGVIEARVQGPADAAPGAAFVPTGLPTVDDATFHVFPAQDVEGRWTLVLQSADAVLNYVSTDECASFTAA